MGMIGMNGNATRTNGARTDMTKESQTAKILKRLKQGEATNTELNRIAFRYSARIHDLRKEGHTIVAEHVKESLWRFVLKDAA